MSSYHWKQWFFPIHTLTLCTSSIMLNYLLIPNTFNQLALPLPSTRINTHWWNFFSCQLLHGDSFHLWNNMIIILSLGNIFEMIHGPIPSFTIFWIGGTVGIMAEAGWHVSGPNYIVGSSSGAYALIGGYLAHLIMNWKETPLRKVWFALFFMCVILTVIFSIVDDSSNRLYIAHIAHGVGLIQGTFVACLVVQNKKILRIENLVKIVTFVLATSSIASVWYRLCFIS